MQAIRSFVFLLLVYAAVAQKITFSGNKEHKTSTTDDLFSELNDLKADFKEQNEVLSFKKDGKNSARLVLYVQKYAYINLIFRKFKALGHATLTSNPATR